MKKDIVKVIALLSIFIAIPLLTIEKESIFEKTYNRKNIIGHVDAEKLDKNWEYVKDVLFPEGVIPVQKFGDTVFLELKNAQKSDSVHIAVVKDEIMELLHGNKILFLGDINYNPKLIKENKRTGYNPTIHLYFHTNKNVIINEFSGVYNYSYLKDGNVISRRKSGKRFKGFSLSLINFYLKESTTVEKRKRLLRYELLRSLCRIPDSGNSATGSSVNSVFKSSIFKPENYEITETDKFLLQKLYANDFMVQFKKYVSTHYPWRYATHFYDKSSLNDYAISFMIFMGLIVFLLSFKLLYNKESKETFEYYLWPNSIVLMTVLSFKLIYKYMVHMYNFVSIDYYQTQFLLFIVYSFVSSFVLWALESFFIKKYNQFNLNFILKLVFTAVSLGIPLLVVYFFGFGYYFGSLNLALIFVFICTFGRGFLVYLNAVSASLVKQKDVELSQLKEAKANAETKMLQSQINPHFLYNALNSIASLALTDGVKTQKMAYSLSDLFKYSINRKGKKKSTVLEEVKMVETYLEIEKIRFGERLQYDLQIEPLLNDFQIPMFLIQPLVENAVKHGVSQNEQGGKIVMKIEKEANGIVISVRDNGPSFPKGLISGHGLQTVYDLLRLSYGDKASLNWTNTPEKMITITIPQTN